MRINRTVLMTDAHHFSAEQAINPYYFDTSTDSSIAQKEHDGIRAALIAAGVEVITTPSTPESQDNVYAANLALVRGDEAILARLPNVRKAEEAHAKEVLQRLGKHAIEVPGELRFSGQGDALACGDYLFCGKGYRSDEAAQAFAAEQLGYTRIQLETIPQLNSEGNPVINAVSGWPDSFYYDIDLALCILRHPSEAAPGLIGYCPEAFTEESNRTLEEFTAPGGPIRALTISKDEAQNAFACNLVSTGETIIMGNGAPELKAKLEAEGFSVLTPHVRELSKGGGYIRCTTLTLD